MLLLATATEAESFLVEPGLGLLLWSLWLAAAVFGGLVTALKGHWLPLALGLLVGGLIWPLTALLRARPGSVWARRVRAPRTSA